MQNEERKGGQIAPPARVPSHQAVCGGDAPMKSKAVATGKPYSTDKN